jgi:hypothetical protein
MPRRNGVKKLNRRQKSVVKKQLKKRTKPKEKLSHTQKKALKKKKREQPFGGPYAPR